MELRDFVRTALEQIVDGVSAAQKGVREQGGDINPIGSIHQQALDDRMWSLSYEATNRSIASMAPDGSTCRTIRSAAANGW